MANDIKRELSDVGKQATKNWKDFYDQMGKIQKDALGTNINKQLDEAYTGARDEYTKWRHSREEGDEPTPTPAPQPMPTADSDIVKQARKRRIAMLSSRRGRQSTVLTGAETLGG